MKIAIIIVSIFISSLVQAENALIYCHEGFGQPQAYLMADVRSYTRAGFAVFVVVFSDEDGSPPVASEDVEIIRSLAENLVAQGYIVSLVGVSLGGFRALEAFLHYPELFDRAVIYMAPIGVEDEIDLQKWAERKTEDDVRMALAYFTELPNPINIVSSWGCPADFEDRILLIYGGRDKICPKEDCLLFSELTGAECIVFGRNQHDVSLNRKAVRMAVEFLRNP